ncbi:MAG: hypothetical protein HY558_00835 [Euryarchaeota archaeon]|nr:hypothetical protein [Euryarchaeota archaeon]
MSEASPHLSSTYYHLNRSLFSPRWVRYSWRPRDLPEVQRFLESRGYAVQYVGLDGWDTLWYVRDGSFYYLQETLVVSRGGARVGDITPYKAVVAPGEVQGEVGGFLGERYARPVSRRAAGFLGVLLFFAAAILLSGPPDRDIVGTFREIWGLGARSV